MTCAACAKAVERVTKKLDGVENSSVNIATEKANIEYDSSKIKISQIKSAIEKAGYSIIEEKKESLVDEDKLRKEKEMKTLFTKFIIAVGFSVPLFYIAMGPMISKPFGSLASPKYYRPNDKSIKLCTYTNDISNTSNDSWL